MHIALALTLILLLTGCNGNTLRQAEAELAASDFTGALKTLQQADSTSAQTARLKAFALFVEERPVEAFRELKRARSLDSTGQHAIANIFLRAASSIAREKDRSTEDLALLDSAATLDPGLREQVVTIAWQRGVEYLAMSGDAGYRFMAYANKLDKEALDRLRGRDVILARRYDEFAATELELPAMQVAANNFRQTNGRVPQSMQELTAAFPEKPVNGRSGWTYTFIPNGSRIIVEARAALNNPYGIPVGTLLKQW